jgi:L-ribulose-5-phosphate 3-epimerase
MSQPQAPPFEISLAQWSLHRTYFGRAWGPDFRDRFLADPDSVLAGEADPLDFPRLARQAFHIDAVEYVNTFFFSRATDRNYLKELKARADGEGVRSLLIMCDALGDTGASDRSLRLKAVDNHRPWLDAAAFLGCRSIRVNAAGPGEPGELAERVAESLRRLAEHAAPLGLDVLVENHGGASSDAGWLAGLMALTAHPGVGTLPDFGNFRISGSGADAVDYDRYRGVAELMPWARAVSAKSYDFDISGEETTIDYARMLEIVLEAGYRGHVGIEYEGSRLDEADGIRATRDLLLRLRERAAAAQSPSSPA